MARSSVCKSALHDFRISSWNPSARTVDVVFKKYRKSNFSASLRNGILSKRPTRTCAGAEPVRSQFIAKAPINAHDYPVLKTRPNVTDVKDTSGIVSWDPTQDDGEVNAANYWIQYRKLNESWDKVVVVSVPNYPKYSIRLNRLRSGEAYEVRVLVIDSDGKYRETGSLTTTFRTLCGRPTSPPTNVKIDNSSADSVLITWESGDLVPDLFSSCFTLHSLGCEIHEFNLLDSSTTKLVALGVARVQNPPRESWLCWSVNVTLEVNGTTESFNLTEPGVNATDRFVVSTRPFTELTVRLRLDTPEGISSQWTRLWTVRYDRQYIQQVAASGRCTVTVWGMLTFDGLGALHRVNGSFNTEAYLDVIQHIMLPFLLGGPHPDVHFLLQQDRNPVHTARRVRRCLVDLCIEEMLWPPKGADMNPIENVWGLMKKRLSKRRLADSSRDALWQAVQDEWTSLARRDDLATFCIPLCRED
ncbi:hypothetical protein HPB47_023240 [Ixodes persulcatus]|uniref:Uncharacterized protein n=1 Tax=Ixodes persulcatus TaxID=34615 RepID=A0AC60Q8M9_IXOPE|nr:hypothetical protein HPB47_023240 [Ixodes persulcatus]